MLDEQQIIELLQSGDKKAISLLYDRYSAALYGVASRIVKSEVYKQSKGTLFTWMLNITRNTAIDKTRSIHYRKSGKVQPIDHFVNNTGKVFSHEMNVCHIGIRKKIEILEEKYRTIIDLIYFNGYTQKEVSEKLGLPLGTVKSRIKIALRELRKALSDKPSVSIAERKW